MRGVEQMAAEALKRPGGPSRSWDPAWGSSARGSGSTFAVSGAGLQGPLPPLGASPWDGGRRGEMWSSRLVQMM